MLRLIRAGSERGVGPDVLGTEGSRLAALDSAGVPTVPTLIVDTTWFDAYQVAREVPTSVVDEIVEFASAVEGGELAARPSTWNKIIGLAQMPRWSMDSMQAKNVVDRIYRSWYGDRARADRVIRKLRDDRTAPAIIVQALGPGPLMTLSTRNPRDGHSTSAGSHELSAHNHIEAWRPAYGRFLAAIEAVTARPTQVTFQDRGSPELAGVDDQHITTTALIAVLRELHTGGRLSDVDVLSQVTPGQIGVRSDTPPTLPGVAAVDASPGVASGRVFWRGSPRTASDATSWIFLTDAYDPDDIPLIQQCAGAIGTEGGKASHLALVCRGLGKPAVTGAGFIAIDHARNALRVNDREYVGDVFALVDGTRGTLLIGDADSVRRARGQQSVAYMARATTGDLRWLEELAEQTVASAEFSALPATTREHIVKVRERVRTVVRSSG